MGKYLSFAKQCLQDFKPKVEERTGINLDDLIVKDPTTIPEWPEDDDASMFTLNLHPYENTVFVNEKNCRKEKTSAPYGIIHEMAHKVHDRIIEGEVKRTKGSNALQRLLSVWKCKRFDKIRSFQEGFATYMALDDLVGLHDDAQTSQEIAETKRTLGSYMTFESNNIPYEKGYKFFRKILYVIGEDKVFEVAKSPPMSGIEVKIPFLYLLRKYPLRGIWYMPDFLFRCMTTKIVKAIFGYADFDFPTCVKKGSGKGKIFKASPSFGLPLEEVLPSCRFLTEGLDSKTKKPYT